MWKVRTWKKKKKKKKKKKPEATMEGGTLTSLPSSGGRCRPPRKAQNQQTCPHHTDQSLPLYTIPSCLVDQSYLSRHRHNRDDITYLQGERASIRDKITPNTKRSEKHAAR
jgi:hypothetical protein